MEKLECSYTASRNVNGVATVEKSGSSSKGKTELPYNPAIPLLNIYPRKKKTTYVHIKIYTWIFIAILFTIAKIWEQPKCPLTGDQTNCGTSILWNIIQQ